MEGAIPPLPELAGGKYGGSIPLSLHLPNRDIFTHISRIHLWGKQEDEYPSSSGEAGRVNSGGESPFPRNYQKAKKEENIPFVWN